MGAMDVVLRRCEPSVEDVDQEITQIIHIRSVWRSIPGRTIAHPSQINATVSYVIQSGRVGAMFEGAGAVMFKEHRRSGTLTGSLDLATLRPTHATLAGGSIFERAQLSGKFTATNDRRRVTRIVHEIERLSETVPVSSGAHPAP